MSGNNKYVVEGIPCKIDECFDFRWHVGPWKDCEVLTQNDTSPCIDGKLDLRDILFFKFFELPQRMFRF